MKTIHRLGESICKRHRTKIVFKVWVKDLNEHFSEEGIQMVNRHIGRCSVSLAIRDIQIKTTLRHHCTRMAMIKKTDNNIAEDVEKLEFSYITVAGGNVRWYCLFGRHSDNSSRV